MNHIVLGGINIIVGVMIILLINYKASVLSIENKSVGRQLGFQGLLFILGVLSIVINWLVLLKGVITVGLIMTMAVFAVSVVDILIGFLTMVEVSSKHRVGVNSNGIYDEFKDKYNKYVYIGVLVGLLVSYIGYQDSYVFTYVGIAIMLIVLRTFRAWYMNIVRKMPVLTEDELLRKRESFDNADDLHELDNNLMVENLKTKARKMGNTIKVGFESEDGDK